MKDINESSMSRIYQKLVDDSSCALISTYRSERSENENRKLLQELKQDVRVKFGFIEFIARWSEKLDNNEVVASDERSLLIPNISLAEAMQLAKKYNQASFIYKNKEGCREICATKFESWDSNSKIYMPGEVVRTFNTNRDDKTILNLEDAKEIFAKRKGGPASYLVKGGGQKAFHLSEVLEVVETRASYFHKQPLGYNTIFKEVLQQNADDQIVQYIKDNYKIYSYNDPYLWSTFILPTGEFIAPENDEYEDDYGEHANITAGIAENCFDDNWMAAEEWLENNCVKCNVTFPYIAFPSNSTNKQYWAAESWLEGLKKRGADSYYVREESTEAFNMDMPIQIVLNGKRNADNIYDMSIYEPDEIIDLVKRGRISGMLSEATKVGVNENMELNQVPDRKQDGQSRITFGDGNRERILAYLGLDSFSDLDELEDAIARAFEVEDEYQHQLKRGEFGYALTADFESIPHIIEDPADYKDLEEIESFGGITVYRKIKK